MRAVLGNSQESGLERIRRELVAALSAITSVRKIDSFGSVATGCADQWSDLDLLISCEVPERAAWLAAAAIRSTKPVAFYRMFTGVAQPSGRYWFCNESPFHRLDVTFHSPEAHVAVCRSGVRGGHPIHLRPEHVAHVPADLSADRRLTSPASRVDVTPSRRKLGGCFTNTWRQPKPNNVAERRNETFLTRARHCWTLSHSRRFWLEAET
jgi:hypothetical protein